MPDVEHPDRISSLINFVKNAIYISQPTEKEAADLPFCCLGFACKWAAMGQVFEGI